MNDKSKNDGRTNANVDHELYKQLKVLAAQEDRFIGELLDEAMALRLAQKQPSLFDKKEKHV